MKIADYEQMMAHLMRQGYNKGGYVRLKKGGRPSLAEGTFKPRLERGKKLLDYINNLSKGSIVDYNKLANKFNVSPATVYRAVQTRPDLKTAGVEKNKAISQEVKEAHDKLKKSLKRNPTKNELIRATGRNAEAINTAQKTFKLNFFNKPGVSALPPDVLKESVQKGVDKRRTKKEITQPSSFVEEGKLKKVNFPNKKMEDAFKANVELYHSFPQGSTEAKKVGATLDSFKQFYPDGVTDDVLRRHVAFFRNKLNLKFPKQEYEGQLKTQKIINKRREKLIREVSDFQKERQIGTAKREEGFGRSGKNLDLAHRASLKQFKDFNLPYLVDNLGLDTRKLNQEILPPLETEINSLHKQRMKLIKGVKPGNVSKEVSKKLEDINIKLSNISMKTNGALQAVLLDEKTLKPFVFNKNYANVIGQGLIDKPVKDLSKADIDFIKSTFPQAAKTAQQSGPTLGANIGLLKGVGETIKAIPTPTGAVALNLAFQPDLSSGIDRAALGAEAAFAPELVRQTSRVSSAPIVQRFFNLGLSPQLAARAARVVSPLGLATLAGEGVYQLGRLGAEQRRRMQEMTPEQRRLFDAEQQSISEFAAAGGGIAKLAGKESGPPPEKGPDSEGLASLLKNVKKR
jgi:hypothetical protein